MKLRVFASLIAFLVMIGLGFFVYTRAVAPATPTLTISNAWARSTEGMEAQDMVHTEMEELPTLESGLTAPAGLGTSAVYLTIKNAGLEGDRLVRAETPAAGIVQIHKTERKNGVTMMLSTKSVEIPGRRQVEFKPGGLHFMLMDLKQPLHPGDRIQIMLEFEKSGKMAIDAEVRSS